MSAVGDKRNITQTIATEEELDWTNSVRQQTVEGCN